MTTYFLALYIPNYNITYIIFKYFVKTAISRNQIKTLQITEHPSKENYVKVSIIKNHLKSIIMKKSIPPIDELIERLSTQIEARHEGKKLSLTEKSFLKEKWLGNEKRLLAEVKSLEINHVHYKNALKRQETRVVTFATGVDILGFQTFTTHLLRFENSYKDPKRFKKQGSDFHSECTHSSQFDFVQNGFKTRLI